MVLLSGNFFFNFYFCSEELSTNDDFKKLFSAPKIEKNRQVQFSRACQDELISLKKIQNFKIFFVYSVIFLKTAVRLPNLFQYSYRHVRYIKLLQIKSSFCAPNFTGSRLPVFFSSRKYFKIAIFCISLVFMIFQFLVSLFSNLTFRIGCKNMF